MSGVISPPQPWCTLDYPIDHPALLADLDTAERFAWEVQATAGSDQHVRKRTRQDWLVLPIVSPNGDADRTDPGLPGEEYAPVEMVRSLPAIAALIANLPCELMAVRLLRLRQHAQVRMHVDSYFGFHYGKVRLHVPLATTSEARMIFGNDSVHWKAGRLWYGDFAGLHTVRNNAAEDRVHLVLDCVLSEDLLAAFPPDHCPAEVLISRPPRAASQLRWPPGQWRFNVARRALDWSGVDTAEVRALLQSPLDTSQLDEAVTVTLCIGPGEGDVALRLPSGVLARLHPVTDEECRVGGMPEETLVVLEDRRMRIVRRVGTSRTTYPCTVTQSVHADAPNA